jgi:hypothetical protein
MIMKIFYSVISIVILICAVFVIEDNEFRVSVICMGILFQVMVELRDIQDKLDGDCR